MTNNPIIEWESVPLQLCKVTTQQRIVMAGGGSHAWNYVLEWTQDNVAEPSVYIERFPFYTKELLQDCTAIIRINDDEEEISIVSKYHLKDILANHDDVMPMYCPLTEM